MKTKIKTEIKMENNNKINIKRNKCTQAYKATLTRDGVLTRNNN